jgi:hypothetical protein
MPILYLNNTEDRIEAICKREDPMWETDFGCEKFVVPDTFDFTVEYTNDAGEPRLREMTVSELQNTMTYREYRYNQYPDLGEQLDKLFHDLENGTLDTNGEFFTALQAVKNNNPKP